MARQRDNQRRERMAARRLRRRGADQRAKAAFLSVVSHELRTPLNIILGQADLMADEGLPPQVRRAASAIRDAGEGLYKLLNDILELAKLEGGEPSAETESFDIRALVEGVRRMSQAQAWARDLDLEVEFDTAVPLRIRGDASRIRQTLVNLVGNALKFTEQGGVRIRAEMDGARLKMSVLDTGIGIDRARQSRLFAAFEQDGDALTRHHNGLGLGLALCRRLVAAMGGEIGVRSAPGAGSTFWFTAGVAPQQDAPERVGGADGRRPDPSVLARLRGKRVLAADDNPQHREMLTRILTEAGLAFELVDNGLQAAEVAGRMTFDVILLDAHMPVVDGIQAARMIRTLNQRQAAAAIIIACSEGDAAESDGAPVSDSIVFKPYSARTLLGAIASILGENDEPPFDAGGVRELEQTVGRAALVDVLSSFLASASEMTKRIDEAARAEDALSVEQTARDLAGAAGGIGLSALTAAARELSQAARKRDASIQAKAAAVSGLAAQADHALTDLYPELSARPAA